MAVRIVGHQSAARSHEVRDLLTRASVPYWFFSPETEAGRQVLADAGEDGRRLPVMLFYSGSVLVDPSNADVVDVLGVNTSPPTTSCDVLVVGAGPAGLAAAVYAASEGLDTMVVEPEIPGGQAGTSSLIRNYLGLPSWSQRPGSGCPGHRAGLALRRNLRADAARDPNRSAGSGPDRARDGRQHGDGPGRRPRLGRGLAPAERSGPRGTRRGRGLLRSRRRGGPGGAGPRRGGGRRRELGRPSRCPSRPICAVGHHAGTRSRPRGHHVELPGHRDHEQPGHLRKRRGPRSSTAAERPVWRR